MNRKSFVFIAIFTALFATTQAQTKIGFCNVEYILLNMPETQTMNTTLQTFRQKLGEELGSREKYAQTKLQEYQEKATTGLSEAELKPLQDELVKLDTELREKAGESEKKLMEKRNELLSPITEKVDTAIKDVAKAEGYLYVLNSVDGSGVSLVLSAPEENNITLKVMTKLGIPIPEEAKK